MIMCLDRYYVFWFGINIKHPLILYQINKKNNENKGQRIFANTKQVKNFHTLEKRFFTTLKITLDPYSANQPALCA